MHSNEKTTGVAITGRLSTPRTVRFKGLAPLSLTIRSELRNKALKPKSKIHPRPILNHTPGVCRIKSPKTP